MKCEKPNLAASTAYRYHKCRCDRCRAWKSDSAKRTNDLERARERARKWRLENPEKSRLNSKNYQKNNPHKVLEWSLKKYGLSPKEYNKLLKKQNGVCKICGQKARGMQHGNNRLCVDHDHETGEVRGLLCGACNIGIGHFEHSAELLRKATKYLE